MKNPKKTWTALLLLAMAAAFGLQVTIQYSRDMKAAYARLDAHAPKTLATEFGTMSYIDEGEGEAILISHGIFGGYDQGIVNLRQVTGEGGRKLSISRFGYLGSALPEHPTPANQAKVFKALLDELGIKKAYILATSAGGAAGFRFALDHPDQAHGLILLSSGMPVKIESAKEVGMTGPSKLLVNDFAMWFLTKYFKFALRALFGSEVNEELTNTLLPTNPRKQGIFADTETSNADMLLHYDAYPVEKIKVPLLVIHAKDDPMTKYEHVEKFLARVDAKTAVFETGGHLISGQGDGVSKAIENFIKKE